jgi:hypothetical protein
MANEDHTKNWPLSNYPILIALLLLITTAVLLELGSNENDANQLAIYAYFLLVAGITIRFFELTLPETFILKIKEKILQISKNAYVPESKQESKLGYFSYITRNVFLFLLTFYFIAMGYGAIFGWFFVDGFIKQLGYIIIVFLALYLVLMYRMRA